MKKAFLFTIAAAMMMTLFLAPVPASAARVVVFARPAFGGFYGPYWGSYWGPAGPAFGFPATNVGEVKLDTKANDGEVFINGAFAGNTKDARTMHLHPGTYTIEVRHAGQEALNEQVFVIAGKTLHLHAAL